MKNENLLEENSKLHLKIRKLAKQIRSRDVVASILEEDETDLKDYNDLIESKGGKPSAGSSKLSQLQNGKGGAKGSRENAAAAADPEKMAKEAEFMKKRNEQLMQILLEFENENKLLEKGLREIHGQLTTVNTASMKSSKGGKNAKENVITCPTLDKLLAVIFFFFVKKKN